jgi:O-antigen ligase
LLLWELLAAVPLAPEWRALRTEIEAVFQNPNGHWQISSALALNAVLWAGVPVFLNGRRTAQRPSVSDWALFGFLGLTVAHYACRYSTAAGSTEPLLILAGIWVASVWRVVGSLQPPRRFWPVFWVGVFGLAVISLWHWPLFRVYHYREARRATGLWNNPNTYGLLAACLSAACMAWLFRLAPWKQTAGNQRLNQSNIDRRAWLLLLPLVPALLGMVRSYSRGAWLGFLGAMMWCGWVQFFPLLRSLRARARAGSIPDRRRWLAIRLFLVVLLAGGLSSLWFLKDIQTPLLRRVGTVANHTDRSWRNRVDAWVGAARMTAARPVTGWGLNQVEATYAREFKPAHLKETAAIQLNDFLTLVAGMGVPALVLFLVLVVSRLCLAHRERNPNVAPLLVLLVGCWFDGVLFRIPLAVPFWVLLLAGTGNTPEILARPRPSSLSSANFTGLISG